MISNFKNLLVVSILVFTQILTPGFSFAEDPSRVVDPIVVEEGEKKWDMRLTGFDIIVENDTPLDQDNRYTSGMEYNFHFSLNKLHDFLVKKLKVDRSELVLSLGQTIYTPTDKDSLDPADYDLPFAGILHFRVAAVYGWEGDDGRLKMTGRTGVTFLIVGPSSLSEDVQGGIHELMGGGAPNGWPNQITDQFGIGISQHFFYEVYRDENDRFSITPYVGGEMGNIRTYGEVGVRFDFSVIGKLVDDFQGRTGISPSSIENDPKVNLTVFFDANGKAYLNNYAIDGKSFIVGNDPHGMELERFVGEIRGGIEFSFLNQQGKRFYTMFYIAQRTATTHEAEANTFMGFNLMWEF